MSNDISVHLRGFCGTTPVVRRSSDGNRPWAQFRLASTPSQRDAFGQWQDGETVWVTVKVFGALALNVGRSVRKSDPLVVSGRLRNESWTGDDGAERSTLTVMADTVGHDLTLGSARFSREVHEGRTDQQNDQQSDGQSAQDSENAATGTTCLREGGQGDEVDARFTQEEPAPAMA